MDVEDILSPNMPMSRIWYLYGRSLDIARGIRREVLGGSVEDAEIDFREPSYIIESVLPMPWELKQMCKTANEWLMENKYDPIDRKTLEKHGYA